MRNQTTSTLLMIKPVAFGFNEQTAINNYFQQQNDQEASKIQKQALIEFEEMTNALKNNGVNLIIIEDTLKPHTPDSIFPNNWISFHENGIVALYPMYAENRRLERRADILKQIENVGFIINKIVDYTTFEKEHLFLEGTGSMIFDRVNNIAYAALSERTSKDLFLKFCTDFHFTPICFQAYQTVENKRLPIYHTNVMMSVADKYAIVCLDSIDDDTERKILTDSLLENGKEIIKITEDQVYQFAGNMLQIENRNGEKLLVMSECAYNALNTDQIEKLNKYNQLLRGPIPTIEKYGGGSARCMMAEIFLSKQ